ncbi:DUF262 domain-containing protein [Listeria booriae]|uniref:DUF262 domain-containing protein n=1 Tax=Listeria booriae TaxID=1552123 RepID=A0A841YP63_9LIST|nr:DUF262 domain-containing protein [Listeria booriae]MBC1401754.1 DUF262 domain-containing protein [Listeria booriae]MBC1614997.1 DUF262 domain-containing protein [Listeria booriae]
MNISPTGMSILEAYNLFRKSDLLVNRTYQRKLVWTKDEKEMLIDSIIKGYPLPLFLFSKNDDHGDGTIEILDGVQRLTAIFDFIENRVTYEDSYFDLSVFPAALENSKQGIFQAMGSFEQLNKEICLDFLNYQLAVTTFAPENQEKVIDVFGRINSQGRQLSSQEKRQAGVTNIFSELVRDISEIIRGDSSVKVLPLFDMPQISLEDVRNSQGYSIYIEDMFWFKSGVLNRKNIRASEDEEVIADLLASIIFDKPFELSKENLDKLYDDKSETYNSLVIRLKSIGVESIKRDFLKVFEVVRKHAEKNDNDEVFQWIVSKQRRNPSKYAFYAVFMSFYDLIIKQNKVPDTEVEILTKLTGLQKRLVQGSHSVREIDRTSNINIVKGLIQDCFIEDQMKGLRSWELNIILNNYLHDRKQNLKLMNSSKVYLILSLQVRKTKVITQ